MITLNNISYTYNKHVDAITSATAVISPGIYLLVGENGAGKTTLMHILAGLRRPSTGSCDIDGLDPSSRMPSVMSKLFFLPDDFECPFATINKMAYVHGCFYPKFDYGVLAENLRVFGMTGNERIKAMSLGMRRKALVAYALALGVDLLMLDEPTNGIDIESKKELKRMIGRCVGDEQTVIVSTHTASDLGSLYDSIMVMHSGRLMLSASLSTIIDRLAFVHADSPIAGVLYQEPDTGVFRAIIANDEGRETDVDFGLLYTALQSDKATEILNVINPKSE